VHLKPFEPHEIETFRQVTFDNLTWGLKSVFEAMKDMALEVVAENAEYIKMIANAPAIGNGEPYQMEYCEALKRFWVDEAALPEK
jgi:guanine nucleotide-binding protein subunit alpha, other